MKTSDLTECKHKIGEYVVYKNSGICKITDIKIQHFPKLKDRLYYVCNPVYDQSAVVYIPADSIDAENKMQSILTADEIDSIILSADNMEFNLVSDAKQRSAIYEEKLLSGDRAEILCLIKCITREKAERESQKKKLYAADAKILATAEKIITEEFAFALGIDKKDVLPYIINKIQK